MDRVFKTVADYLMMVVAMAGVPLVFDKAAEPILAQPKPQHPKLPAPFAPIQCKEPNHCVLLVTKYSAVIIVLNYNSNYCCDC